MFKMTTLNNSGTTVIWVPGTNVLKIFPKIKDALVYMDIMKSLYYIHSRRKDASEPYPVRSLIPNLSTKKYV